MPSSLIRFLGFSLNVKRSSKTVGPYLEIQQRPSLFTSSSLYRLPCLTTSLFPECPRLSISLSRDQGHQRLEHLIKLFFGGGGRGPHFDLSSL